MLKPLFALVLAISLGSVVSRGPLNSISNSRPDFSGIWNARILSDPKNKSRVQILRISYKEPKLKITRILKSKEPQVVMGQVMSSQSRGLTYTYFTDGRGETNTAIFQTRPNSSEVKSKTERMGDRFVITTSLESKKDGHKITTAFTVILEVSADGKTLTETTDSFSEGIASQDVAIYERSEGTTGNDINADWVQKDDDPILSLIIEHRDPEIKVTRRIVSSGGVQSHTSIYFSDARGETNVQGGRSIKSTTKWQGNNLLVEESFSSFDNIGASRSITWQIASDNNSLIEDIQLKMSPTRGAIVPDSAERRLFYARSSELPTTK